MGIKLSKNMLLAIKIGIQELDNSSVWENFVEDGEREQVYEGIEELSKIIYNG